MSFLEFILSDAHFCLSYEKVNYYKIQNSIIKTAILFDRQVLVCIYTSKVLFLTFI